MDKNILATAYKDEDPQVRKAAIRISETFLKENDPQILTQLEMLKADTSADVRIQLALSLRYSKDEKAKTLLNEMMLKNEQNEFLVKAATKSLEGDANAFMNTLRASISRYE